MAIICKEGVLLPLQDYVSLLHSTRNVGCNFQVTTGLKSSLNQNTAKLTVLTEIQLFLLNKHSSDCCKSLDNFHSSDKIDFDHFANVAIAFMERQIFRGSYHSRSDCLSLYSHVYILSCFY